jgi:hypothetical protein
MLLPLCVTVKSKVSAGAGTAQLLGLSVSVTVHTPSIFMVVVLTTASSPPPLLHDAIKNAYVINKTSGPRLISFLRVFNIPYPYEDLHPCQYLLKSNRVLISWH